MHIKMQNILLAKENTTTTTRAPGEGWRKNNHTKDIMVEELENVVRDFDGGPVSSCSK